MRGTGASSAFATARRFAVLLTAGDIAARFGIAERTAQERICEMRALGYPVVRAPRGGRGQPPWAVRAEDYAARLGVDVADVIDAARAA